VCCKPLEPLLLLLLLLLLLIIIIIIDVAIVGDRNAIKKEAEKILKYVTREREHVWNVTAEVRQ
jgi:riboflavin synthase